jgi:hypothetical protein
MDSVKRGDYVRHLVQQGGLTYVEAERIYGVLMGFFADALAAQRVVHLGRVGVLKPTVLEARTVTMGFKRSRGRVEKVRREFYVGQRVKFVFKVGRPFAARHGLAR